MTVSQSSDTPDGTSLLLQAVSQITAANPRHGQQLQTFVSRMDATYRLRAERFFGRYAAYMASQGRSFGEGVAYYLGLCKSVAEERKQFLRTGQYSSNSFAEVASRVYLNPATMEAHMHGLVFAQFLWVDQYARFAFFCDQLSRHRDGIRSYLEVGGGHALYIGEAVRALDPVVRFDLVDVSPSSIELARGMLPEGRVHFELRDMLEFEADRRYDFITMGEVIEHLEQPRVLLAKVRDLLSDDGHACITAPANAPMIDHIYLFRNADEIHDLLIEEGFEIEAETRRYSEDVPAALAQKLKVPEMYAALVRRAAGPGAVPGLR